MYLEVVIFYLHLVLIINYLQSCNSKYNFPLLNFLFLGDICVLQLTTCTGRSSTTLVYLFIFYKLSLVKSERTICFWLSDVQLPSLLLHKNGMTVVTRDNAQKCATLSVTKLQ